MPPFFLSFFGTTVQLKRTPTGSLPSSLGAQEADLKGKLTISKSAPAAGCPLATVEAFPLSPEMRASWLLGLLCSCPMARRRGSYLAIERAAQCYKGGDKEDASFGVVLARMPFVLL